MPSVELMELLMKRRPFLYGSSCFRFRESTS